MDKLLQRILDLRKSRGWSEYKLQEMSGVRQSTISAWYSKKNLYPSVSSLRRIAKAFDMSLSLLVADEGDDACIEVSADQMELLRKWSVLNERQKNAVLQLLDSFSQGGGL